MSNPFADINAAEFLKQQQAAAPTTAAAPAVVPSASATSVAPTSFPSRPYNPNQELSQLDALALPDEKENARLSGQLTANVANLMAQKSSNERKQAAVGNVLAQKGKAMEEEMRKLQFIRQELSKLDHSLSRNIDVLRAEIESVGREVNSLQTEFTQKEKDYLECRKALAKVKQRKLMLTSHLDYIILTNENEKASKLTELEISLGLAPSTPAAPHALPSPPAASATPTYPASPHPPSSGASAAALAAAAESEKRAEAARLAAMIPPDHPGLRLDHAAPVQPGFGGFEEEPAHAEPPSVAAPSAMTSAGPSNPFAASSNGHSSTQQATDPSATRAAARPGPSPAAIAASRHVAVPPRGSASASNSAAASPSGARPAQSTMSIANRSKPTPLAYTPDGQFAGFAE